MARLDPSILEATLIEELRAAWRTLRANHPSDHFYSFGVFTTSLAEYLSVTASTEEGLAQVAAEYVRRYGGDVELQRASLRWSPCDSPLHSEGDGLLPRTGKLREDGFDPYEESEEADAAIQEVFDACVRALKRLDDEGLFGRADQRARIVISIWMGDQSDEDRVNFAGELNPKVIADRFASELEQEMEALEKLSKK